MGNISGVKQLTKPTDCDTNHRLDVLVTIGGWCRNRWAWSAASLLRYYVSLLFCTVCRQSYLLLLVIKFTVSFLLAQRLSQYAAFISEVVAKLLVEQGLS